MGYKIEIKPDEGSEVLNVTQTGARTLYKIKNKEGLNYYVEIVRYKTETIVKKLVFKTPV